MPRRSSSLPTLIFLVVLALVAYYTLEQLKASKPSLPDERANGSSQRERIDPEARRAEATNNDRRRWRSAQPASCQELGVTCNSAYFGQWQQPADGSCTTSMRNGYPVPDPRCTPGGVDPTVSPQLLRNPEWRTRCLRNCAESEAEKHVAYGWYGIARPRRNSGENQLCELDHLVPLELGGADGMGNIWPQCGPDGATLDNRYFKVKDRVENYLAHQVKAGRMALDAAQQGIATDWTQYIEQADRYCATGGRC